MDNTQESQKNEHSNLGDGNPDTNNNDNAPEVNETGTEDKSEEGNMDPPPSCKKCFSKFADRKSVVCPHEFCNDCWETMVSFPTGHKKSKGNEDKLENPSIFTCSVCAATNQSVRPKSAYPVTMAETLGKDVKKLRHFKILLKREKIFPEAMTWSKGDECVLVDTDLKEVLIMGADGQTKKHFPYLRNHSFQGGLALDSEGIIRISLKNERFSGISYYTMTGQFKFSAFLYDETPHIGDIVSLDLDEHGNMVALDKAKVNVCYISREKRVESHAILSRKQGDVKSDVKEVEGNVKLAENKQGEQLPEKDASQHDVLVVSEARESSQPDSNEPKENTNDVEKTENMNSSNENQQPGQDSCPAAGPTSIAVNSWGQVVLCDQSSCTIRIIEKHEHYDEEVGLIDLSGTVSAPSSGPAALKLIVDEHDNILLLDRSANKVIRYNTEGHYLDTLVQFPSHTRSRSEDDDDEDETDIYVLKDISCNTKGTLAIMYTREPTPIGQDGVDESIDNEVISNKRTEIALYSYSTARKQRRKERKIKESKSPAETDNSSESKSKCCVVM